MIIISRCMVYLKEAVVKIQGQKMDILAGVSIVMECCKELATIRNNIDGFCKRVFEHSKRIAETSGIIISMPRISKRQQHRQNPEFTSIEDYFKITVAIPFIDYIISDISSRFNNHSKRVASLENILPSVIHEQSSIDNIQEAVDFYSDDLPNSDVIDEEYSR